jgi:hypothetical protein
MLIQTLGGWRVSRALIMSAAAISCAGALGFSVARGLEASPARAQSNAACILPYGGVWVTVCENDPTCSYNGFIRTAHAAALPYQYWIGHPTTIYRWYFGSHSDTSYKFSYWPQSAGNHTHTVSRSGNGATWWHAGTYICR